MSNNELSKIHSAQELCDRISRITEDVLGVARDLAAALDLRPELMNEMCQLGADRGVLRRLERLGRGQIHSRLVFADFPGVRKLMDVPLSEQTIALDKGVEVLDADEATTRNIPVEQLSREQTQQVFGDGEIRTIAQQRTWLRKKKAAIAPIERDTDYRVFKDRVVTSSPGTWTKQLILQWLTEMG
jgi:hypothetical protein